MARPREAIELLLPAHVAAVAKEKENYVFKPFRVLLDLELAVSYALLGEEGKVNVHLERAKPTIDAHESILEPKRWMRVTGRRW